MRVISHRIMLMDRALRGKIGACLGADGGVLVYKLEWCS